jgi:ribonuclease BN (tRNA processing enzyme)
MIRTRIVGLAFAGFALLVATGAAAPGQISQELRDRLRQLQTGTPTPPTAPLPGQQLSWITLGTQSGPFPDGVGVRSEPANLLVVDGQPWIIDCGDGAMERLAAAGFQPRQVKTAFISHLHMDHIGGLFGLIALHSGSAGGAADTSEVLTIYGPPGIDVMVNGILQSLTPTTRGLGQVTRVVVVKDGSDLTVNGVRVRAVRNSHFDGSPEDSVSQSLSYRYDYKGFGIGYTGDTGPSDAVTRLEKGADLLVSEVGDKPAIIAQITNNSTLTPEEKSAQIHHFEVQHLSPQEAGKIAEGAEVRRLVFTHLGLRGAFDAEAQKFISGAHETFKGEVIVAHDLDKF